MAPLLCACSASALDGAASGGTGGGRTTGGGGDAGIGVGAAGSIGASLPLIPVGLDAFTHLEMLPNLRIGQRAYLRSTYDRSGGNEGADASHFLRQERDDFNVTLDAAGRGVLEFVRTNHWHGSPWHYVVDAAETVVSESTTADPSVPVPGSVFLPEAPFPPPLALTWSTAQGADLSWVAMPFEHSFTLAYGRTHYGTGYYIYHLFDPSAGNLTSPIRTWTPADTPPAEVLDLLSRAGTDIAPPATTAGTRVASGTVDVPAASTVTFANLTGSSMLRALTLVAPLDQLPALAAARLRVTWDGRATPSIDAPLPLFFGTGTFYNRNNEAALVRALLLDVAFDASSVRLATYFPMPFFEGAKFEISAGAAPIAGLRFELRTRARSGPRNAVGYFHATYADHGVPVPGQDLVIVDTTKTEGGGSWCGSFAGMSWIFSDNAVLQTLEGDPRMFFDDSASPQGYGTGTEEWAGGGDYWNGRTTTLPLAGHPVGAPSPAEVQTPDDAVESAYRLLVSDLMPFGKNARIQLEHGGTDDSTEHYRSVAYWYGFPGACLVRTDSFHVGDPADEAAHAYTSPSASAAETLTSRFELGVVSPAVSDSGRHMTGTSEFTLSVDPTNQGVLLRRRLDYSYPNQRAEVSVAPADAAPGAPFVSAGIWYLAGSNTCVYSNPPGELDPALHTSETSDRRWREDELLLPRSLTAGHSKIRVRIHFTPANLPLVPGGSVATQAWSEVRYWAYSYRMP